MALPRLPGRADAPSNAMERGVKSAERLSFEFSGRGREGASIAFVITIAMPSNFLAREPDFSKHLAYNSE